jgi:hypothetical protein
MKFFNTLVLSAATLAIIVTSSCTQEYKCQCTIRYTGAPGLPDSTVNEYPIRDTKKKAKSTCEGKSATYQNDGITTTETCQLY